MSRLVMLLREDRYVEHRSVATPEVVLIIIFGLRVVFPKVGDFVTMVEQEVAR
jgi:hypothetical protein